VIYSIATYSAGTSGTYSSVNPRHVAHVTDPIYDRAGTLGRLCDSDNENHTVSMAACSALMNETSVYGSSSNPNAVYVTANGVPISTNFGTRSENFDDTAILSAIHKVKT
jgi:hypothetical protein